MDCANYRTLIESVICLMLMLCCFPGKSVATSEPLDSNVERVAEIAYRINTEPVTSTSEQLNILRNQTAVRVGDRFSRYAIQQSVKALYATQQYSQVQVYVKEIPDGLALTYRLIPYARIKEIVIAGVSDSEFRLAISQVLRSRPDGTYVPKIVDADISRIESVCQDYGYFDAYITIADAIPEVENQQSEKQHSPSIILMYQINLGAASTIKALHIQGNDAISTLRLKEACSFSQQHQVYNRSAVDADVASMQALYRENSYPNVTIVPTFFRETGVLQFQVSEGRQVQFRFVSDAGEVPLSLQDAFKEDIISLINTSTTAVWERRIRSYFKASGYHDTTVDERVVDTSEIQLTINPGMRYVVGSVDFVGNRAFSDAELLREMTIKPIGGLLRNTIGILQRLFRREQRRFFYEQELDTDVHRLSLLYGKAGYPKTSIRATLDKQNPNSQTIGEVGIRILIVEEQKEIIHRCDISGNQALDTDPLLKRLQNELPLPQPNTSLNRNVYQDEILKAYRESGYIDVVVNNTYIAETEVPVFQVVGDFSASLMEEKFPLSIRNTFKKHNLALEGVFIATNIGNRWSLQDVEGNPRYTLLQRETHLEVFEHGVLNLTVVTEGDPVAFGKFYFEGDTDVVKQHVLEREVRHLEGTLWTSEELSRAQQSLYSLGVFHGVQVERIRTEQLTGENVIMRGTTEDLPSTARGGGNTPLKTDSVLIKVEKQKSGTYSIGGGYSFAEGPRLTGELTDSNFLFKRNIRGRLRAGVGWRDELGYLVNATLTKPWLIGRTRGSLQLSGRKLEIDDYVRALQGSFILSRRLSESNHVDLRYSYRDLNQPVPPSVRDVLTTFPPLEEGDPFHTTVSSLQFSWTYDSRVRYLNPTGGMLNALTLEYAGGFLQSETSFIKMTTDTRYYRKLVGLLPAIGGDTGLVLATALRLGVTTGLHSNRRAELISFERFWAGGGTTVRGYAERSLGPEDRTGIHRGDVQFIFNTELRFPIYWLLRGALFFDTGNVWGSLEDIDTSVPLPSSVGAGIYLDLGALTAGVDYAIPLVSVPTADTSRVHLRLGGTF
ncbi:MAG: BamA/TamA family outer membrane protein [Candidatus Poribacteria bacterium]|nr:BamA/TamA family outer membrane protein [Candidatus Poribacteria bacterium]